MKILVTGSTGFVGGRLAKLLESSGHELTLLVRDAFRAPEIQGATVAVSAGFADSAANLEALTGADAVFMVSATESEDRLQQHKAFVDAMAAAGVKHVVYLSFQGASADATFTLARTHYFTEQHIIESGLGYTFLRDSFYLDLMPLLAGEDGVIRGPAASGRVAAVARRDVADVAAGVLLDLSKHENKTYTLTGPEALTMGEIAQVISEVTGRQVTFYNESVEEAYESRKAWEAPDWQYDAWVSTYTAIAAGELAETTSAVYDITGHEPTSLAEFLRAQ